MTEDQLKIKELTTALGMSIELNEKLVKFLPPGDTRLMVYESIDCINSVANIK